MKDRTAKIGNKHEEDQTRITVMALVCVYHRSGRDVKSQGRYTEPLLVDEILVCRLQQEENDSDRHT